MRPLLHRLLSRLLQPRPHGAPHAPPPAPTRRAALAALALLAGAAAAQEFPAPSVQPEVRVLLAEVPGPITVAVDGPHHGVVNGGRPFRALLGLEWPLGLENGRLVADGREVGRSLTLVPDSGRVAWGDRTYRGALRVVATDDALLVLNVLPLEDYLRGVVPSEMQANWPLEALKAQAVAARSYLLTSLDPLGDYDLCATKTCQVYRGTETEHPRSDRAVAETAGVVLTYGGDFASTFYHADSGGAIASSAEVWGRALPYLPAQADVQSRSPHRSWRRAFDSGAVARSLEGLGRSVGTVRAVRVTGTSESGRVIRLEIEGSGGRTTLSGRSLRNLLQAWGFKSSRFRMEGALAAVGDGWGHGVGMSQYGARALAQAGYSYGQILAYYYPNTLLQRLEGY